MALNPAGSGWINKYISLFPISFVEIHPLSQKEIYSLLVKTGFFYGVSSELALLPHLKETIFNVDDFTKVNLFTTLMLTYRQQYPENELADALTAIEKFYTSNNKGKKGLFSRIKFSKSTVSNVEEILSARIQESNPLIKKGSSSFFTHILLSIDIIAFYAYLKDPGNTTQIYKQLEYIYNKLSFLALSSKPVKTKLDLNMLELFKETFSALAMDDFIIKNELQALPLEIQKNDILINQLFNLCLLAIYDDKAIENLELAFLSRLANELEVNEIKVSENIESLHRFSDSYGRHIQLFTSANPVKHFYKETRRTVKILILKNADRILKELQESKELVKLLRQSTLRDLNDEEKKKVKEQLLDICKTIPSLTIFIIPGGSLLLPLLIKLIPQLLPSAFDENRIEK